MYNKSPKAGRGYARAQRDKREVLHAKKRAAKKHFNRLAYSKATYIGKARADCHQVFDRLWCGLDAPMVRKDAYRWLAKLLRMPNGTAHIANLDEIQCWHVAKAVKELHPQLFRKAG